MKVFIILSILAGCALADHPTPYAAAPVYPDTAPAYTFDWNVYNSDNYEVQNFRQQEDRDGYETHGEYSVALPDGRTQIVTYKVEGDSGFIADVRYEGEAQPYHPKPAPAASYKPAPVSYKPAPAPVTYKPAPVVYKPAPVAYKPAPVAYKPAPVAYKPAPVVYKPAPKPAPIVYKPAPTPIPVTYEPAPIVYKSAPTPAPSAKRTYGPVKFNPFG